MLLKSRAEFEMGMLEESRADNEKAIQINDCPEYQFDRAKNFYINQTLLKPQKIYLQNFYRIFRHQRYTNTWDIAT